MDLERLLAVLYVQRKVYYTIIYLLMCVSLRGMLTSSLASLEVAGAAGRHNQLCSASVSFVRVSLAHHVVQVRENEGENTAVQRQNNKSASTKLTS